MVYDDRVMAIVVRLVNDTNEDMWVCVNKVAHLTIGTREDSIKAKESNVLLEKWLEQGTTEDNKIHDVAIENRPTVQGTVRGVCNSHLR